MNNRASRVARHNAEPEDDNDGGSDGENDSWASSESDADPIEVTENTERLSRQRRKDVSIFGVTIARIIRIF